MGGITYPDGFTIEAEIMPGFSEAGMAGIIGVWYLMFVSIVMAFSVVSYIFYSLGLSTIAGRRGIKHRWLAWLPIGSAWILGSISDQYQYLVKGRVKNRRKLLLGLSIALCLLAVLAVPAAVATGIIMADGVVGTVVFSALLAVLGGMAMIAIAIVMLVFEFKCLFDLYRSCNPDTSVVFLVLSIVFSETMPFFVFACRKKDKGMPPRRQPAPQQVVVPTVEVVVDPTVVEKVVVPTVEPVVDPTVVEKVVIPTVEPVTEEGFAQPEEFEEE